MSESVRHQQQSLVAAAATTTVEECFRKVIINDTSIQEKVRIFTVTG